MSTNLEIDELSKQLKDLKAEKGKIAGQFKHVEKGSEQFAQLKAAMQSISDDVKRLESSLKAARKASKDTVDSEIQQQDSSPTLPLLFSPKTEILGQALTFEWLDVGTALERWKGYLATQNKSFYHSPRFAALLSNALDIDYGVLVATDEAGSIVGGIPLHVTESKLFGRFATSIPHVNYGGPISAYKDVRTLLLAEVPSLCSQLNLSSAQVRCLEKLGDWPASDKKVSMLRSLPSTVEEFDKAIGAKVRAQAKKASKANPSIRFGGTDLLDDFYRVFSRNMRDLGTPVYAKSWFKKYLNEFPTTTELCVGYVEQRPVSCGFLVYNDDMVEIPWASTLREANRYDMNMWMYHQILKRCIDKKFQWFDFGRSTRDAGTFKFKRQWGAKEFQHYWYDATSNGFELREGLNPDNPKFKLAISVWKRLPVGVTNFIGPMVAKDLV